MIAYLRIVLSVVIVASVYGLFVPILISMKDTTAVISGFALAILTRRASTPFVRVLCLP
ncbi:Uncharacterised protein [Klebsiella pneumoniae]|nr:Uncharacterised protein [Klebsiella pneumoniae]